MANGLEIFAGPGCSGPANTGLNNTIQANSFKHHIGPIFKRPPKQPTINYAVCFCCFANDVPLTDANKCRHKDFVNVYLLMAPSTPLLICNICHHMLKKIEDFRKQIQKNFENFVSRRELDERCVNVNNVIRKPTISIISLSPMSNKNKDKSHAKRHQTIQNDDPLSVLPEVDDYYGSFVDDVLEKLRVTSEVPIKTEFEEMELSQNTEMPSETTNTELTPTIKKEDVPSRMPPSGFQSLFIKMTRSRAKLEKKKKEPKIENFNGSRELKQLIGPLKPKGTKQVVNKVISKSMVRPETPSISEDSDFDQTFEGSTIDHIEKASSDDENEKKYRFDIEEMIKTYTIKLKNSNLHKFSRILYPSDKDRCKESMRSAYEIPDDRYKDRMVMIVLSHEEVFKEREKEKQKESYAKSKYRCKSCIQGFQDDVSLGRHNEQFHKMKNYSHVECPICKGFLPQHAIELHRKFHIIRYVCLVCKSQAKTLQSLTEHYNNTHKDREPIKDRYRCKNCNFMSECKITHKKHIRTEHKIFKCGLCDIELTGTANYVHHTTNFHKNYKREIAAKRKEIKAKQSLTNVEEKLLFCKPCNKFFKHEITYRSHMKKSSAHSGVVENECDYCHKKFKNKNFLPIHIHKLHMKIFKNVKCEFCSKEFEVKHDLQRHIRSVHEKKIPPREMCEICGKNYSSKKVLRIHMVVHTGERPWTCDLCSMTFKQSHCLHTHKKKIHNIVRQ